MSNRELMQDNFYKVLNRGMVKDIELEKYEHLVGYIYNEDGTKKRYELVNEPGNIARFICCNDKVKTVCDIGGYAFLSTEGRRIDYCMNGALTVKLLTLIEQYKGIYTMFQCIS